MPGEYDFWADVDVPQSLDDVIREMTIDEPVNPDPTEQDVLDQMGGDPTTGEIDRSGEKTALYGNKGYTGNEASSGFGMKDVLGGASSLLKNDGLMKTMLGAAAGVYGDKKAEERLQAQLDAIKQRQTDLNKSVPTFGKAIHGKSYKG